MSIVADKSRLIDERLAACESLELFAEDLDNSKILGRSTIWTEFVKLLINENIEEEIMCNILHVIGTCAQNNLELQIILKEMGAIELLLKQIQYHENHPKIMKKIIFALSCLIRNCDITIRHFVIDCNGLGVIDALLKLNDMKDSIREAFLFLVHCIVMDNNDYLKQIKQFPELYKCYNEYDFKENYY